MANEERASAVADRLLKRESRTIAERQERKRRRKEIADYEKSGSAGKCIPTFERANKANGSMRTGQDGVTRIEDSPLEKLFARRMLDKDSMTNFKLKEAGVRYYRDWYEGQMSSMKAINNSIKVDGGGAAGDLGLPSNAKAYSHRNDWRRAAKAIVDAFSSIDKRLGPRMLMIIDAVVLHEEPLLAVGREHSGYSSNHPATAIALDRLRLGLRTLAVHYGIMDA